MMSRERQFSRERVVNQAREAAWGAEKRLVSGLIRWSLILVICLVAVAGVWETARAQGQTEGSPVELSGQAEVIHIDDYARGRSELHYFLRDEVSGQRFQLHFSRRAPAGLATGSRITVRGLARGRDIDVREVVLPFDQQGAAEPQPGELAQAAVTERNAIVMLVDLEDFLASQRYSLSQIEGEMYTGAQNVDGLYETSSYGLLGFEPDPDGDGSPDVFGPFAINATSGTCSVSNAFDWADKADAEAIAAGKDLGLYEHRVYVLPRYSDMGCTWAGLGHVGCGLVDQYKNGYCQSWITAGEYGMIYAHELGHNVSMHHASTDPGNDGTIDSEYGDWSDPMGNSVAWHQFNAPHAEQKGWVDGGANGIVTISASGTYDIFAMELPDGTAPGPRVLKVQPLSGTFYYLSYRQSIGAYGSLSSTYTRGVNIHRYPGPSNRTMFIASLSDASPQFQDAANGITFTQVAVNGDGSVSVQVTYGCGTANPTVTMNPATGATPPDGSVAYSVTVTNRDSGGCDPLDVALGASVASPLTATWSPDATITALAAGASESRTLTVTANGASDGSYTVAVEADGGDAEHQGSAEGAFVVDGTAPDAPVLSASAGRKNQVSLTWTWSGDGSGSGLSYFEVWRDGGLLTTTGGTSYTDSDTASGTDYTYDVGAVDLAGNMAMSNAATVTTGTKKGGGKGGGGGEDGGTGGGSGKCHPKRGCP